MSNVNKSKRIAKTAIFVPMFYWFEWMLVAITFAFVSFLKEVGFADWQVFPVLWMGNIALSWSVVFASDKSDVDITLMGGFAKWISALKKMCLFAGLVFETLFVFWNLFWTGPAQVFILMRKIEWIQRNKVVVLVAASALQMAVWTMVYCAGYDDIIPILKQLMQESANWI